MNAEVGTKKQIDDAVEAEWARLHDQIELADGFWLAWVFSTAFDAPRMMAERVRRTLQESGAKLRCWRPETPKELHEVLPELLDAVEEGTSDCLWVEALAVDVPGVAEEASWSWAWRELLMRANERRERLLRTHRGGLVFVGAPEVKVLARENAPDLWTIRAMVIDVPRAVVSSERRIESLLESIRVPLREDRATVMKEVAEAAQRGAEDALRRATDFMPAARPLISWAYALQGEGRHEEARALMTHLLHLKRTGRAAEFPFEARAYAVLAECAEIQGDRAAATDFYGKALQNVRLVSESEGRRWARRYFQLLVRQGESGLAREILRRFSFRTIRE
jgi:tetratricopeptide (TPR) repeat protein